MAPIEDDDDNAYRHPWLGVEVRHLATLSAVARAGSFRQAARELGYVQSAVSQQVARLERVVGARLVERRRGQRNVSLTPVGEVLAERGERILGELQAARLDLSVPDETIRLAVASDVAPLLSGVLSALRGELPGTLVQVIEAADDDQLVSWLEEGDADVAIGGPLAVPGIGSVELLQDPFVLLVRPGSRLAGVTCVSNPADLAGERIIVPASVVSHGPLHAPGLLLDRALPVPLAAVVPPLVARGHGVGLVPRSALDHAAAELACVPTAGLIAPRRLMLGWLAARRRTARLQGFCDAAVRAFLDADVAVPQAA